MIYRVYKEMEDSIFVAEESNKVLYFDNFIDGLKMAKFQKYENYDRTSNLYISMHNDDIVTFIETISLEPGYNLIKNLYFKNNCMDIICPVFSDCKIWIKECTHGDECREFNTDCYKDVSRFKYCPLRFYDMVIFNDNIDRNNTSIVAGCCSDSVRNKIMSNDLILKRGDYKIVFTKYGICSRTTAELIEEANKWRRML